MSIFICDKLTNIKLKSERIGRGIGSIAVHINTLFHFDIKLNNNEKWKKPINQIIHIHHINNTFT